MATHRAKEYGETSVITFHLDSELYRELKIVAAIKDRSIKSILNYLVKEYVLSEKKAGVMEGQTVPVVPFVMNEPEPEPELLGDPDFVPSQPPQPRKSFAVAEKPIPNPVLPELKGVKVKWKGKEYVFPQKEVDMLLSTGQIKEADVIG